MRVIFTLMLVLAAMGVNAQVTTSAISGKVTDEQNETVIGATVIAIHEPSGTQYGAVTNVDGRYTMQGMRTGGPYKLTVSYVGYQSAAFTGIMLPDITTRPHITVAGETDLFESAENSATTSATDTSSLTPLFCISLKYIV